MPGFSSIRLDSWFEASVPNEPDDPRGQWGCHTVENVTDLYLAAAYSLCRCGSPAYVRQLDGTPVGIDRLSFEVFDALDASPASLLDACAWEGAPSRQRTRPIARDTIRGVLETGSRKNNARPHSKRPPRH